MKPAGRKLAAERRAYGPAARSYLKAHPYCQVTIAIQRLNEAEVIAGNGSQTRRVEFHGQPARETWTIPPATEIHHRNRRNGPRLNRQEFWMSASPSAHRWVEQNPGEARRIGLLCPINAQPDGGMPDGTRCLTTSELLRSRAAVAWITTSSLQAR